jgi:hypothetical protein
LFGAALGFGFLRPAGVFFALARFGLCPFDLFEGFTLCPRFGFDFGAFTVFVLANARIGECAGAGLPFLFGEGTQDDAA